MWSPVRPSVDAEASHSAFSVGTSGGVAHIANMSNYSVAHLEPIGYSGFYGGSHPGGHHHRGAGFGVSLSAVSVQPTCTPVDDSDFVFLIVP